MARKKALTELDLQLHESYARLSEMIALQEARLIDVFYAQQQEIGSVDDRLDRSGQALYRAGHQMEWTFCALDALDGRAARRHARGFVSDLTMHGATLPAPLGGPATGAQWVDGVFAAFIRATKAFRALKDRLVDDGLDAQLVILDDEDNGSFRLLTGILGERGLGQGKITQLRPRSPRPPGGPRR